MGAAGEDVLYVALHEHNEAVSIHRRDLPLDPNPVLDLLSSEAAPLQAWFDTAKAYLANGNIRAFRDIIADATSAELLKDMLNFFKKEPTFERMSMFCALAAYYIEQARGARDINEKNAVLAEAERSIRQAEEQNKDNAEMLPSMARAFLALARGSVDEARMAFRHAEQRRHNGHVNHAPVIGLAALEYNAGQITAAIELYAKVLRANPHCPPEVRLGIAACYYRAGKLEAATAAYNRVLELDAGNADALLGLAIVKFGSSNVQEGLNSGLQLLQRAYAVDPTHPGVLCVLSHFSLLKGEAEQALRLAQIANEGADTDRLRAVSLTLLGRCHHALGDLQAAQYHYAQAIRLDPKAPLPHLGTAQAYLATGSDPTNAVSELELVLKAMPGNGDAMWLLGGLLPVLPDRVAKTLQGHREAAARQMHDAGLQEMLGELLASIEPSAALVAFNQALALHRQKQQAIIDHNAEKQRKRQQLAQNGQEQEELLEDIGEDDEIPSVPAKLLNNAAVLKYRAGDLSEAASLMDEATHVMMSDPTIHPMQKVTMGYNMARLREATGQLTAAREAYQALLHQFPGYIDCYLRLSSMAKAAGDIEEAQVWAQKATEQAGGHVDAQAMLACLHLERKDLAPARKCVEAVGAEGRHDPYMLLTHANVILAAIPTEKIHKPEVQKARRDYIVRALKMYQQVLKSQPENIYAANGLGICLAELGHMNAAKQAFDEVIRATSKTKGFVKLPETYVNLGNIWLARQQYNDALKMYEHASKLYNHKNAQILLYIARAHHDAGDQLAAKRYLLRALHIAPGDIFLRFNLGFVLQELAMKTFKKKYSPGDPKKLGEYEVADAALSEAAKIFRHLLSLGKEHTRLDAKKLQLHADYCQKQLPAAAAQYNAAVEEAKLMEQKARVTQMQLAAADAERRALAKQKALAQEAEAKRKKLEAHKALDEARAKIEQMRQQRAMAAMADTPADGGKAAAGGKKKRKKGANEDMSDFYVDDAQPIERLPKAKKTDEDIKETFKRTGLDSDDDDEGEYNPDEEELFGSDDEGQQGQGQQQPATPTVPSRGRLKLKQQGAAGAADDDVGDGGGVGVAEDDDGLGFEDEAAGDTRAADFVDELFVDHDEATNDDGAGQQQQRKRARQALESDDEDEQVAAAAMTNGDDAAAPMDEDDALDDLF